MLTGYAPSEHVIKGAKIVSLASLFRAPLDDSETIIRLARAAKEQGAILCADTKIPTYRKLTLDDIREILPLIDYIFPNENEGEYYTGETEYMAMAEHFRSLRECCQYGTACAAVCVQSIGATTGVKSRESVEEFLKEIRS